MAWPLVETFGMFIAVVFLLYYYAMTKLDYWRKRGVKGPKPLPFVGNFLDVFLRKASTNDCFGKAYYDYRDEPMVGIYGGHKPMLVLRDPELIKDVLIKDFSKFADRSWAPCREVEPLSEHLFRLDAERWKPLRARLSPVFTSGKLKEMFYLVLECANHFEQYMDKMVEKGEAIECREISAKFTMDVIGSCAFGIEVNALRSENNEFRRMGRKIFETSWQQVIRDRLREYPFLFKHFGRFFISADVDNFFVGITKEAVEYRMKHNFVRHDFVDTLIDLKLHPEKIGLEEMDDFYMTAQALVFFAAGFETSSITITNAVYELALNPTIQEKVREDIKTVLKRTNGEITYDCIKEMKYLEACFQETLRKYPVVLWLSRAAGTDYTFRGTKVSISKGQEIYLPVYAIHNDPEIYPEPEKFDPDRFVGENAKSRHPMFFLPFGDGPRNCIGARFAKNQSKLGLIKLLLKYKIDVCEKTCKEYCIDKKAMFLLQPTHGIYVKMTRLEA